MVNTCIYRYVVYIAVLKVNVNVDQLISVGCCFSERAAKNIRNEKGYWIIPADTNINGAAR